MKSIAYSTAELARRKLTVRGQVQGVGFRPFAYRLADELSLAGFVRNDGVGVTIEVQGPADALDHFVRRLRDDLPPLARIDRLGQRAVCPQPGQERFEIRFSDRSGNAEADVAADSAVCDDCLRELFDPSDRRFGYSFINCTNCGPRYSIVQDVPYDRPMTTMARFAMCPACRAEYDNPADRRFHAQPTACPQCGPRVWATAPDGKPLDVSDAIAAAAQALLDGRIVAIRGLGGFHLAVRADNDDAVARLRQRKGREHKPLAIMVATLHDAEHFVELTEPARQLLASSHRPIVLAPRKPDAPVADSVAPRTSTLGVMLPYTPLHHLLFAGVRRQGSGIRGQGPVKDPLGPLTPDPWPLTPALVMTSGNISDEPIAAGNDEALSALGSVADLFLLHDREIFRRIDDSVAMAVGARLMPVRRARGYVPTGIDLPGVNGCEDAEARRREETAPAHSASPRPPRHAGVAFPPGLAVGGELKNVVAIVRSRPGLPGQAILSEHIGDLKDGRVYRRFERVIEHLAQISHVQPAWIAHDLHPMYLSTQWALRQGLPLVAVQHHHAHVAACLAENGSIGPAIGIAADGVGYGDDGTIWGGEILLVDLADYERMGWVRPIALPGGDAAAVHTARPAAAWLFDATAGNVPTDWLTKLLPEPAERDIVMGLLGGKLNCPPSSALGRYFDAAAALLGLCRTNRFEAQGPMALEAAAGQCDETLPFELRIADCGLRIGSSRERELADTKQLNRTCPRAFPACRDSRGAFHSAIRHPQSAFEIDLRQTVLAMIERVDAGADAGQLSAAFHNTIAAALSAGAIRAAEATGVRTVALSGGVFCNRYLSLRLERLLSDAGLKVLTHSKVPCNDGGLALGQAAVAMMRMNCGD